MWPFKRKDKIINVKINIKSQLITADSLDALTEPIIKAINKLAQRNIKIDPDKLDDPET